MSSPDASRLPPKAHESPESDAETGTPARLLQHLMLHSLRHPQGGDSRGRWTHEVTLEGHEYRVQAYPGYFGRPEAADLLLLEALTTLVLEQNPPAGLVKTSPAELRALAQGPTSTATAEDLRASLSRLWSTKFMVSTIKGQIFQDTFLFLDQTCGLVQSIEELPKGFETEGIGRRKLDDESVLLIGLSRDFADGVRDL